MAGSASIVSGAAGRYATALFDLAEEKGALDAVRADVAALKEALGATADLRRAFADPAASRAALGAAAAALADKMGLQALTKNFLGLMAAKRRLGVLGEALDAFELLAAEKRGETTAEVRAAAPMSEAQQSALSSALAAALGRQVHMQVVVDPELIGGLVVKVGSRMIDASLQSKLARLRTVMKEVG